MVHTMRCRLEHSVYRCTPSLQVLLCQMTINRDLFLFSFQSQYIFLHQCIMDCLQPKEKMEENIYENAEMIYVNATALREFHKSA